MGFPREQCLYLRHMQTLESRCMTGRVASCPTGRRCLGGALRTARSLDLLRPPFSKLTIAIA
jgi:hypothetical protein